ncbi:hypothetical protein LUZ61_008428 [Rhynchospora tenuis]|uniref:Protein kinase domain-containing protein n=1 Tax=Rhynchospora tenuis TaxID=198213 RepID=A0AAD5ZVL4_9POAL|nr:hypothetical protein LUZ61_008428 [Rhynchospora tenuis]
MGCFSYFCGRDSKWKEEASTAKWRVFSLKELHSATNNFNYDNKLGEGSFGSVYWGQLWDGSQIAVKRLKVWNDKAEGEFTAEVEILGKMRHKNLLCLRGCCAEGQERLIVYDYMPNLSLHSHLHGSHSRDSLLDWKRRMSIAIASAEGIAYLHHHATPNVIHQDIKASNILLDTDFKARVADFGFAKLIPDGDSRGTNAKGALGYHAQEYTMYGKFSESCDVYSFGILLLEIVSGKKPVEKLDFVQKVSITNWALPLVREGRFNEIVDSKLNDEYIEGEMKRLVLVGLVCAQNEHEKRPTMLEVAALLKGESKEKMALIESDEMFQPGSRAISEDTEVLTENLDSLAKESVEEVKETMEIGKTET